MATHSSTLSWKIPWTEEPCRLQSIGSQRDGQDWATSLLHTMVEVVKIMSTSFKRSRAGTATLSAPSPAAGHRWPTPPPGKSFRGHCSFLLGPGAHKVSFVPSKGLFPQACVSSGSSMVGLMATSSKRAYAIPRSAAPRAPAPGAGHCWPTPPQETLKHSSVSIYRNLLFKCFYEQKENLQCRPFRMLHDKAQPSSWLVAELGQSPGLISSPASLFTCNFSNHWTPTAGNATDTTNGSSSLPAVSGQLSCSS